MSRSFPMMLTFISSPHSANTDDRAFDGDVGVWCDAVLINDKINMYSIRRHYQWHERQGVIMCIICCVLMTVEPTRNSIPYIPSVSFLAYIVPVPNLASSPRRLVRFHRHLRTLFFLLWNIDHCYSFSGISESTIYDLFCFFYRVKGTFVCAAPPSSMSCKIFCQLFECVVWFVLSTLDVIS